MTMSRWTSKRLSNYTRSKTLLWYWTPMRILLSLRPSGTSLIREELANQAISMHLMSLWNSLILLIRVMRHRCSRLVALLSLRDLLTQAPCGNTYKTKANGIQLQCLWQQDAKAIRHKSTGTKTRVAFSASRKWCRRGRTHVLWTSKSQKRKKRRN